jgi:chromosome segregation ATPase
MECRKRSKPNLDGRLYSEHAEAIQRIDVQIMFDSMKLETLLLAEGVLILLIICALLLFYALKQRELHRHILEEYRKLRHSIALGDDHSKPGKNAPADTSTLSTTDHVAQFLAQANEQALERYKKITHATVPRLGADLSFSAKVAALRYLYSEAEAEIHRQPPSLHCRWMTLERKYADIVRWIGQPTASQKPQRNQRLRLLQERIDALKPFEDENARLVRKLSIAIKRQATLEEQLKEGQQTILNMQKTIRTLQRNAPSVADTPEQKRQQYLHYSRQEHLDDAVIAHDQGLGQLNSISDISNQKSSLLRKISDELHITFANISTEQRQKLEDVIKTLEKDLLQSDQHISNLKKELKTTRDNIPRQPFIIAGKTNQTAVQPNIENFYTQSLTPEQKADKIEEVLKVVHTKLAENEENLRPSESDEHWSGHKRTLAEIQNLRQNNQNQRNMIIDLEKELRALRREALETDDEKVSEEKYRDITRLEKLVKECEHCIETLESEVDLLHMQLQESQAKAPVPVETPIAPDILRLNQELETVSGKLKETVKQYQKTHSINQFTLDILTCNAVETIARRLIQAIKDLNIIAGFSLRSTLGHAEYYVGDHFSAQDKIRVKKASSDTAIGYLNEGILFANKYIHLMLKSPPDDDADQSILERTLTSLINIAAERIQHLEAEQSLTNNAQNLGGWVSDIKHHLNKIDMQHAHQTEESRRVVENLIKELNHATEMIDMSGSARIVFENAISECRDRIAMLMESGKNTDDDFSRLLEDLDKVEMLNKSYLNH